MITFATEPWSQIRQEIYPLWVEHHAAIADPEDKDRVELSPDWDRYDREAAAGTLHITAAREAGRLVGYVFVFVQPGLHYSTTLFGHWDLYWVSPGSRGHWVGVRLFEAVKKALKARGVVEMTNRRKIWHDTGPIFRRTGWHDTEIASTIWIGD